MESLNFMAVFVDNFNFIGWWGRYFVYSLFSTKGNVTLLPFLLILGREAAPKFHKKLGTMKSNDFTVTCISMNKMTGAPIIELMPTMDLITWIIYMYFNSE